MNRLVASYSLCNLGLYDLTVIFVKHKYTWRQHFEGNPKIP